MYEQHALSRQNIFVNKIGVRAIFLLPVLPYLALVCVRETEVLYNMQE